jgi:spoIIIJ-associated protein
VRSIEAVGRTVEEATLKGLAELGLSSDEAELEILAEPSSGFLGLIGSRQARVRLSEKKTPERYLLEFLQTLLAHFGLQGQTDIVTAGDKVAVSIGGSQMGILIGKRGQTLDALQYLLNVIYHRHFAEHGTRVVLDVGDYREKREQTLRELAYRLAKKATCYHKEVVLEPMNPQERRIIHSALQDHPAVFTYSQGEEPYRKVVIAPK